jgi:hypothetical protein
MEKEERTLLATAYANAWYAVKGTTVMVTVEPRGWFTVRYENGGMARGVRTRAILDGLVTLTSRLAQNDITKMREAQIEREQA